MHLCHSEHIQSTTCSAGVTCQRVTIIYGYNYYVHSIRFWPLQCRRELPSTPMPFYKNTVCSYEKAFAGCQHIKGTDGSITLRWKAPLARSLQKAIFRNGSQHSTAKLHFKLSKYSLEKITIKLLYVSRLWHTLCYFVSTKQSKQL